MTFRTAHGFFHAHCLMTAHALLMVGTHQPGCHKIFFVKWLVVAALTFRRLHRNRTVVMTSLADGHLVRMKIACQFVVSNIFQKRLRNLAMRKLSRFILLDQCLDHHFFRNILQSTLCRYPPLATVRRMFRYRDRNMRHRQIVRWKM